MRRKMELTQLDKENLKRNRDEMECELKGILSSERRDSEIQAMKLKMN